MMGTVRAAWGPSGLLVTCRWRARQLVKNIPPSDMAQIKAKVAAMGVLQELRQDWGCRRAWVRDYLSSVSAGALKAGQQGGAQGRELAVPIPDVLSLGPAVWPVGHAPPP